MLLSAIAETTLGGNRLDGACDLALRGLLDIGDE